MVAVQLQTTSGNTAWFDFESGDGSNGNPFVPRVTPPRFTTYRAIATSAGANIKNSSAVLFSIACTNLNAATRFFQIFDATGVPSGTPLESYPVYGNGGFLVLDSDHFGMGGISLSTGLTWGFSTTASTYTAGTAGDAIAIVRYI